MKICARLLGTPAGEIYLVDKDGERGIAILGKEIDVPDFEWAYHNLFSRRWIPVEFDENRDDVSYAFIEIDRMCLFILHNVIENDYGGHHCDASDSIKRSIVKMVIDMIKARQYPLSDFDEPGLVDIKEEILDRYDKESNGVDTIYANMVEIAEWLPYGGEVFIPNYMRE